MLEIRGNLWNHIGKVDVICITTNGFVKRNGEAVMGRGCALEARNQFPSLALTLGKSIKHHGNRCNLLAEKEDTLIYSFPVKHARMRVNSPSDIVPHMRNRINIGDSAPGWALRADINLIIQSANQMIYLADNNNWNNIIIPRPGCGAGELTWSHVSEKLHPILDDRFKAITF